MYEYKIHGDERQQMYVSDQVGGFYKCERRLPCGEDNSGSGTT